MRVIKRNTEIVDFSLERIENVLKKAGVDAEKATNIANKVREYFIISGMEVIKIDEIQNIVIKYLEYEGLLAIKEHYLSYMTERNNVRKKGAALVGALGDIINNSHSSMKENANVNADGPMGKMLKFGSVAAKEVFMYNMPKRFAKAHSLGEIHIHDLEFHDLTATCCQLDLEKLFTGGFGTGHGKIREPGRIQSYASLACIAIQSNQNDQHGGQSIPLFDYYLAKGVVKSYQKNLRDILFNDLSLVEEMRGNYEFRKLKVKELLDWKQIAMEATAPSSTDPIFNKIKASLKNIKPRNFASILVETHRKALEKTDEETYQAMESVIHNLNTMHSRAGAQVPFSSLNYGTDISLPGRMITRNILLALEAGMGDGEIPIFPIHIFKVKSGVNYEPGTPNYDLFQLSCRVTSKRMFPNYAFLDVPYNLQYYKHGKPETEVVYMGCVHGEELITYKIRGKLFVDSIDRAYKAAAQLFGEISGKVSTYVDVEEQEVFIFDSNKGDFVRVKKMIKNPNQNNWFRVKFSNGRNLLATADHPLPVKNKGRTLVADIQLGDQIPIVYSQYTEETENISVEEAWLLGLLLCDSNYNNNIIVSLGLDETDILAKLQSVIDNLGYNIHVIEQHRGIHGDYNDVNIKCKANLKCIRARLEFLFGATRKDERKIPDIIFRANKEAKLAFIAGMLDADGYINHTDEERNVSSCVMSLGTTNKRLSRQQMALIQATGYPVKTYLNNYSSDSDKIRFLNEFPCGEDILRYMASEKKKEKFYSYGGFSREFNLPAEIKVTAIERSCCTECSYDVETESDMFDVSGIQSHNCRTRVIGNVHDKSREIVTGRGNLSFTSVNLPRIAITADGDMDKFWTQLQATLELVRDQLLYRLSIVSKLRVRNFPFLMGQGVWIDSENLEIDDEVGEVLKHGTLSIGFIGLAETLIVLTGKHHGESGDSQKLGLQIVKKMRNFCDMESTKSKLNFTLIATPAEGLSGRFLEIDRDRFGVIPGVTNHEFYTNSFHVPVYYGISMAEKIKLEAPYHELCNAGHISYVEVDGAIHNNPEAVESIVRMMYDSGIGYGGINHPVDIDPVCGYNGVIEDTCPKCGRREKEGAPFRRIRRVTGYLSGSLERFNKYKIAEVSERSKHDRKEV